MDPLQQRTLYVGLVIALAFYALSFVTPFLVEGETGSWISVALTLASLVFMLVWFLAVRRGFRLGRQSRQVKRLKEREKQRPTHTRLR